MNTYTITAADVTDGEYTGSLDLSVKVEGHVEIEAGLGRVRFAKSLWATGCIRAGVRSGISAGEGISAGGVLKVAYRVFAGISRWIEKPTDEQLAITCSKLESGTVCYGNLIETGETPSIEVTLTPTEYAAVQAMRESA